jgi:hypothetical protein
LLDLFVCILRWRLLDRRSLRERRRFLDRRPLLNWRSLGGRPFLCRRRLLNWRLFGWRPLLYRRPFWRRLFWRRLFPFPLYSFNVARQLTPKFAYTVHYPTSHPHQSSGNSSLSNTLPNRLAGSDVDSSLTPTS